MSSTFYGSAQLALLTRVETSLGAWLNLAIAIHKPEQGLGILVIKVRRYIFFESSSHHYLLSEQAISLLSCYIFILQTYFVLPNIPRTECQIDQSACRRLHQVQTTCL